MTLYRLTKARYQATAFSGEGGLRSGGRWHPAGLPVVYASDAPSSALLEILVHTEATALFDHPYVLFSLTLEPARHLLILEPEAWPTDWRTPLWPRSTQEIGRRWVLDQDSVVLQVPSAIIPLQHNYLINPHHPHFGELVVEGPEPFDLDPRLGQ